MFNTYAKVPKHFIFHKQLKLRPWDPMGKERCWCARGLWVKGRKLFKHSHILEFVLPRVMPLTFEMPYLFLLIFSPVLTMILMHADKQKKTLTHSYQGFLKWWVQRKMLTAFNWVFEIVFILLPTYEKLKCLLTTYCLNNQASRKTKWAFYKETE